MSFQLARAKVARKKLTRQRHELAESALVLQEQSPDGVVLLAPVRNATNGIVDFTIEFANPAAETLLQQPARSLVGKSYAKTFPDGVESGRLACYIASFESGESAVQVLSTNRYGDRMRSYRVALSRTTTHLALCFTDVTEQIETTARIRDDALLNETLVRVALMLAGELDTEAILRRITDECTALCHAEAGAFRFNTPHDDDTVVESLSKFPLARATPIFGVTFSGEGVLRIDDVRGDARFVASSPLPSSLVSYLAVPVVSRTGKVHGGLFFGHSRAGVFTERDEKVIAAVAGHAALALDNAQLFDDVVRARAESERQRDRLALTFQRAPVGVAVLRGPTHVFEMTNAPYRELVGGRDVDGKAIREALPELEGQGIFELLDGVFQTRERFMGNGVRLTIERQGQIADAYFNFVYEPLLDADGKSEGIVVVCIEVTEHMVALRQARAMEQRFRSLVAATSQMVWTADPEGVVHEDSPKWREFTGQSVEAYLGRGWMDALHPEDRELARGVWRNSAAPGRLHETTYRLRRHDGVYRYTRVRGTPVLNDDGTVREWIGTNTDVTDERTAREHLELLARASTELAGSLDYDVTLAAVGRLFVPTVADWCWVDKLDEQNTFRRVHISHASAVDASLATALRDFPPQVRGDEPYARVLETGRGVLLDVSDPATLAHSEPAQLLLQSVGVEQAILVPLSAQGLVCGVVTLVASKHGPRTFGPSDLALAEELGRRASVALDNATLFSTAQAERGRAEHANRAKDEFLATVSHELRTPLNAMLGWIQLLRGGALDAAKTTRALETVERNAKAQAQLIDDVLDVSRIISGKLRLNPVEIDLVRIVEAAIDSVGPTADAKGVRIQAMIDPDAGAIRGDADRLQQVCWNLLANAVKFTPRGGRVLVRLARAQSHVEFIVEDTGRGIQPAFLPHVFERFRQDDASTTRQFGGLGLGLAIVKHLVDLHGGTVTAESEGENRGARFSVRLPVSPLRTDERPSLTMPTAARAIECPPELVDLNVLVVDDEPDARELLAAILTHCRARVETAASAEGALAALQAKRFDVIVSDIGMPRADGYSLIRDVRAMPPDKGGRTPAVALTAFVRSEDRTRALLAGFNSHIAQPVEPLELLAVVANLAGRFGRA